MKRHTRATPAGIPRSRSNLTRRERADRNRGVIFVRPVHTRNGKPCFLQWLPTKKELKLHMADFERAMDAVPMYVDQPPQYIAFGPTSEDFTRWPWAQEPLKWSCSQDELVNDLQGKAASSQPAIPPQTPEDSQ